MSSAPAIRTLTITLDERFEAKGSVIFADGSSISFQKMAHIPRVKFLSHPMKPSMSPADEAQRELLAEVIKAAVERLRASNAR